MSNVVYVKGDCIYAAAIEGARRGYNRSTMNFVVYEQELEQHYQKCLASLCSREERRRMLKSTRKDWRNAYLPLQLALVHNHIAGEPCEPHARVFLTTNPFSVFDITMAHWELMQEISSYLLERKRA